MNAVFLGARPARLVLAFALLAVAALGVFYLA